MQLLETEGFTSNSKPSTPIRTLKWCLHVVSRFKPSFWWHKSSGEHTRLRPTAYLDGLRGFAALLVYCSHHHQQAHAHLVGILITSFGYQDQYYFVALPWIRCFITGASWAVTVFFVISGYVLTTKPLKLLHTGKYDEFGENLSCAFFKRWLRLFLPVISTTFVYLIVSRSLQPIPDYGQSVLNWYNEIKNFTFIFSHGSHPFFGVNPHMWTIPVEFQGSIVVFTTLIALSKATRNARLLCVLGLMFYFMYFVDGWYCSVFLSGMLLADLDLLANNNDLPRILTKLERFKTFIFYGLFIFSFYLGGVPTPSGDPAVLLTSPGWGYFYYLVPRAIWDFKWFFLSWAGFLLVVSIPHIPWVKRFFESRFNQYLGRVSFAFYLVHGPVIWTLGDRIYAAVGVSNPAYDTMLPAWRNRFPIPEWGPVGLELNFLLPHLILLPVTLWIAEMVTRFIDEPSVKFPQWLYMKSLPQVRKYEPVPSEEV